MEKIKEKIYIGGKISGLPREEAERNFAISTANYRELYEKVYNPLEFCKPTWSWWRCMAKCLWVLAKCDIVVLMSNWRESRGARIEFRWAVILGKKIINCNLAIHPDELKKEARAMRADFAGMLIVLIDIILIVGLIKWILA